MSHALPAPPLGRLGALRRDPVVRNAALGFVLTALMAGSGAAFWIIAARLRPAADVGLAGSLVTAGEALSVLALLGYNVALVRTMPSSDRPAADIGAAVRTVAAAAAVLGLAYVLVLPLVSPSLGRVVSRPWAPLFALWVAATAVNQLSDAVFLAVDRVAANLRINGILMGAVKCALPFLLAGGGALGLYAAVGTSATIAAVVSIAVVLARLPGRPWGAPSASLRAARRFGQAGYLSETLYLVPQLVFPLIVINALGATEASRYFVAFQLVTLLNALVYVVGHSTYASAVRAPWQARAAARQGGRTLLAVLVPGCVVLVAAAPWLLRVFGADYAADGTATLRVLALGSLAVGLNYWAAMRLRIASHLGAMVGVQLVSTTVMIVTALAVASHGTEAVAAAWGAGQLTGAVLGLLASRTIAPLVDAPQPAPEAPGMPGAAVR